MKLSTSFMWNLLVCLVLSAITITVCRDDKKVGKKADRMCVPITIPMCRGIGYNMTRMPNQFRHDSQEEAGLEVHQFWPLVEIRCSPDLRFFLCSVYAPICVHNYHKPLPACRSVCERARAGCLPVMRQYGFAWPERMRCDSLPVFGDPDHLCMDFNTTTTTTMMPRPTLPTRFAVSPTKPSRPNSVTNSPKTCFCRCRSPFVRIVNESHLLYDRVAVAKVDNCAVGCDAASAYFSADQRAFARLWIGAWAILCSVATITTVGTYLVDTRRFRYPERPIVFLSACYFMVSLGYIVRLGAGHGAVACDHDKDVDALIHYPGTGQPSPLCIVVFLLVYFFGMAASLWWLVLALSWFFATALKWGEEAISACSPYFHLAAWLAPSLQTLAALATSSVDGDSLSGVCYVGGQDTGRLKWFVLAPLSAYLLAGSTLLVAGFVSLFRIRSVLRHQQPSLAPLGSSNGAGTQKLEKLMVRLGIFSVLYAVPAAAVIACHIYELETREQWATSYNCQCPGADTMWSRPHYFVFMLKYFMSVFVGITSGVWIWSAKTLDTWRRFSDRICGCSRQQKYSWNQPPASPSSTRLKGANKPLHCSRQLSQI